MHATRGQTEGAAPVGTCFMVVSPAAWPLRATYGGYLDCGAELSAAVAQLTRRWP